MEINYIFNNPYKKDLKNLSNYTSNLLEPFSEDSLSLIQNLSSTFLKNKKFNNYPELVALGFWLRKSNINKIKDELINGRRRMHAPRGLAFHVAPSNVDTIFVYSIAISLLMGNANIVRLSSKDSIQKDLLIDAFKIAKQTMSTNLAIKNIILVSYDHDDDISNSISLLSDLRIIWGGDETVEYFSNLKSKPSSIDIKFANKYSLSVIDTKLFNELGPKKMLDLAKKFVNDAYSFGQQGCSSPRAICWVGKNNNSKKIKEFWSLVQHIAENFDHDLKDADYIEKFNYLCSKSIKSEFALNKNISSSLVTILDVSLDELIDKQMHCGRGTFMQTFLNEIGDLSPFIDRSIQTISYFGFSYEELLLWALNQKNGIDRIVPIGQSLDFDYIWDGINIFESVSRIINIK